MSTPELDYEANIDQKVIVQGVARNARLGAIVMTTDFTPIYMDGIERWEAKILGKSVEVVGILRLKSLAPKAISNAEGEISHGTDGENYLLENPAWMISEE